MVDMANAIDFRLGHCNGEFHALRSRYEKCKNGLFLPTWKLFNFRGFQVHVHGKLQEKIPGQVQNYQTFQLSLVSVKSLKQVQARKIHLHFWSSEDDQD